MSDLRATNFRGRTSGSVPDFPDGVTVVSGISTLDSQGVRVAGIVTATSFSGDGSSLTSIASIVTGNTSVQTVDTGSDEEMREPTSATLFIKPSQFILGEMSYDRQGVLEGDSLSITVKAWNDGNYASDVLMVVYVMDSQGTAYDTPEGVPRMTRIASTTEPVMAPKAVLESQGIYQTWYPITAVWDEAFIPGESTQDFENVELYAMINPDPEQIDVDNGHKKQDEYLNQKDDNDASGQINVVKDKSSTPSFALGIVGMSVAALIAAAGASLRREEE